MHQTDFPMPAVKHEAELSGQTTESTRQTDICSPAVNHEAELSR